MQIKKTAIIAFNVPALEFGEIRAGGSGVRRVRGSVARSALLAFVGWPATYTYTTRGERERREARILSAPSSTKISHFQLQLQFSQFARSLLRQFKFKIIHSTHQATHTKKMQIQTFSKSAGRAHSSARRSRLLSSSMHLLKASLSPSSKLAWTLLISSARTLPHSVPLAFALLSSHICLKALQLSVCGG